MAGVRVIASGAGPTVIDAAGRRLVGGFAGLWCVNAGYGQQVLVDAATRQMQELPYVTGCFGLGSEPAIRLTAALAERAPGDFNHVYFTLGGPERVAAFYAEPIQGSGGVLVPPDGWMKAMCDRCRSLGILFVAHEVITGFGRTGTLSVCTDDGMVPDMMITVKGLTSGYLPMDRDPEGHRPRHRRRRDRRLHRRNRVRQDHRRHDPAGLRPSGLLDFRRIRADRWP